MRTHPPRSIHAWGNLSDIVLMYTQTNRYLDHHVRVYTGSMPDADSGNVGEFGCWFDGYEMSISLRSVWLNLYAVDGEGLFSIALLLWMAFVIHHLANFPSLILIIIYYGI